MPIQYKIRRGSTSEANSLTLTEGEIYMDLGDKSLRVHDGATQGGTALAKKSDLNSKVDKINLPSPSTTVGSGSEIPVITYNDQGQITSTSTATLNIPSNIATETYVQTQISNLVDSSPTTLNTLNELAAALNDDPNFATTIANIVAEKAKSEDLATVAFSGNYYDLNNKPFIPNLTSDLMNDAGYLKEINLKTIEGQSLVGTGDIPISIFDFLNETNIPGGFKELPADNNITLVNGELVATPQKWPGYNSIYLNVEKEQFNFSDLSNEATYEFWYYPTSDNYSEYIFTSLGDGGGNNYQVFRLARSGGHYGTLSAGGGGSAGGNDLTSIQTNTWNHIAIHMTIDDFTVWFNGTRVKQTIWTTDYRQTTPRIGFILGHEIQNDPSWLALLPKGNYSQIAITNYDKYGKNNTNISIPTGPFKSQNVSKLVGYIPNIETVNTTRPLNVDGEITANKLTISATGSVVANSAIDNYINVGTRGQIFDDGNFHIHSSDGNVWINSLNGGDISLGLQSNSGTSVTKANSLHMNAGYGSIAPTFGVRAWISCGYIGGNMVTNGSGNLSVSRVAQGKYTFTFGTPMPDGNYCVTATAKTPVDDSDIAANLGYNISTTTTGFTIHCARYGTGYADVPQLCVQVVR